MATSAARRLAQLSARLGELDRVIVTTAGEIVVDEMTRQLARDTGGDEAMSGFAGGRYRMQLAITKLGNPAGVRIRPASRQTGMWTILDSGRRGGYQVTSKRSRKRARRKARGKTGAAPGPTSRSRAMHIANNWRAGPFTVKRSWGGRHTWSKGRDAGFARALDAVADELHKAVSARG